MFIHLICTLLLFITIVTLSYSSNNLFLVILITTFVYYHSIRLIIDTVISILMYYLHFTVIKQLLKY